MKKKTLIIIAVVVVVAVAGVWLILGRRDPVSRAIKEMVDATVTLETGAGEVVQLEVKLAGSSEARTRGFKNVAPEVVEEHILYMEYPFDATVAHRTENVQTAIDMAFFDSEGQLLAIFSAEPGEPAGYHPQEPYQYVLMAHSGLFEEKGIDEGSRLRLVTD
jgi:uncharacterized membrane protein (UPF0127 family)